ncbi:hypothetical protein [Leptospira noguchii]|uniref:hypothetical protein n=1 Tax=Leptospira noguchii TaxID=28182 RepID=UPI001FB71C97|nr:hypothetical protein [Leptospira noguchii]UOG30166.1 hypothetical protein MAL06_16490 [Leptospira noguchii]
MKRILESKLNSAKRFLRKRFRSFDRSRLKLNTTLSMNRVVGSKTHIFQVFRQE